MRRITNNWLTYILHVGILEHVFQKFNLKK